MPNIPHQLTRACNARRVSSSRLNDKRTEPVRELDHDLRVENGGGGSVRLVINGTVEALTANEAARFGAMIVETARRAGAVG
ncbi:hypothetical protein [Roseomonas indoligenes]|uniref:Uncharacterized protein n=1 Tax=Roseomonas indoligenes TaxID=2820811 RepID=A0A940S795_9PROT|nr:hypothetical protein [Pararoseomonas indoligenes]MBP0492852.1 hypothetical protein [Pararoseomonas indoligenes]